ncbi:VC0807 family protein [Bacillus sp. P14.5]|uniref:VC0807 family protein n=1 Tax=Bacillus sp. P14.5 TaxID=1983400 RepID=UPI000DE9CAEA|nr:VC0807 family protein [Bacillus sp. P14.5]
MKKNIVLLDLIFYAALPLLFWNVFRDDIGDYYAMLFSSVPAILYSAYRFWEMKRVNVFGIYLITTLVIGTLIDVLAGSALQLLWNNVYFSIAMCLFFLITILFQKPITLYFGLDFAELQGYDRKFCRKLYEQKQLFRVFQWITIVFAVRSGVMAGANAWLITEYGVEAFDKGILLKQAFSWVMTGITVAGFFYVGKIINDSPELIDNVKNEMNI